MGPLGELTEHINELKESLMTSYIVIGSDGVGITNFILYALIAFIVLLVVVFMAKKRLSVIPNNKLASFVEFGYGFIRGDITESSIGANFKKHVSFLATIFCFILLANFIGLIPGSFASTGSISITWALAIIAFVYFNYHGVKAKGGLGYLKSIAPAGLPGPMVPVIWVFEALSLCLRALTLAVRLYGNMLAGHFVLGIFAVLTSVFVQYAIVHAEYAIAFASIGWIFLLMVMYLLEVLVALLQAYVFATLTSVYVSMAEGGH